MKIVMTVMNGTEVERELLSLASSVINNVTGVAIYSGFAYGSGPREFSYLTGR